MMKFNGLIWGLILTITFVSCENKPYDPKESLPEASGELGSVVVVLDKQYWKSNLMTEINNVFAREVASLPQPEPLMDIKLVTHKGLPGGLNLHHSILIMDVGKSPEGSEAYISKETKDLWANGQVVYTLKSPDLASAVALIQEQGDALLGNFQLHSNEMIIKELKKNRDESINDELKLMLGLNADIPKSFTLVANYNELVWLKQQRKKFVDGQDHEIQVGLLFYTYPYTDSLAFTPEKILAKRDSMTKKYVPGMIEGSYMKTERAYGLEYSEKNHNGTYIFETRGVWKMHNAIMGGPFVSLTLFDEPRNRIVTLDGYIYAPHFRKMEYVREVEAMLYSFTFPE